MPLRSRLAAALLALALLPLAAPADAQTVPPPAVMEGDASDAAPAYDRARALYDDRLFAPAAEAFADFRRAYPRDPRAANALYYQAEAALASGDGEAAEGLYAEFQRAYPDHPRAAETRLAIGRYFFARRDNARAVEALTAALDRELPMDQEAEAAYLLGLTYERASRPADAIDAYDRAAARDTPTAPAALYAAATRRLSLGQDEPAAEAFRALDARYPASPENAQAGLALAETYARLGLWEQAAVEAEARRPRIPASLVPRADLLAGEAFLRAGQAERALPAFERVPDSSMFDRRATFGRARIAYDQGRLDVAAPLFAAVRSSGPAGETDDPLAHEATYFEGLSLKRSGNLGEAERRLFTAASRRPDGDYAAAALLELGLLRYERRRYRDGVAAFERLLDLYPESEYVGEAARLLGESYSAMGDTQRAREAYERAEGLGAGTPETRSEIAFQDAYAQFRNGQYANALNAFLELQERDPDGPRAGEAVFWAGEAAFQAAAYARAQEIFERFLRDYPRHRQANPARYALAYTHFRRRNYRAAADAFEAFLRAYDPTTESVPYFADAQLRLGDSYFSLGRFADARRAYARATEDAADGRGADYALYQTAQALSAEGQTDEAVAAFARLATEYPGSDLLDEALFGQGALLLQQGNDAEAATAFARAAAVAPRSALAARALVGRGDALFNSGDYPGAEAAYREVLTRHADSPFAADAIEGLGYALDAQDRLADFERAIADFEARSTNPVARARVQLRRAEVALEAGDNDLAVSRIEALLTAGVPRETEPTALLTLSTAYANRGDRQASIDALRRIATRFPDSELAPEATLQLAEALLAAADHEGALAQAAALQERYPDDAERVAGALFVEARALIALGRAGEGQQRLETLFARYDGTTAAANARRLIRGSSN